MKYDDVTPLLELPYGCGLEGHLHGKGEQLTRRKNRRLKYVRSSWEIYEQAKPKQFSNGMPTLGFNERRINTEGTVAIHDNPIADDKVNTGDDVMVGERVLGSGEGRLLKREGGGFSLKINSVQRGEISDV